MTGAVAKVLADERAAGLDGTDAYAAFANQVIDTKAALLEFCIQARRDGKTIAGYGAPAKGNTLLNYCGIGPEFIPFTVDRSPHKQGMLLPGVRIPIRAPEAIFDSQARLRADPAVEPAPTRSSTRWPASATGAASSSCRSPRSGSSDAVHRGPAGRAGGRRHRRACGTTAGYFARTFCAEEFAAAGLPTVFPQCNISFNARAWHAARHALAGRPVPRGQAGALHARRHLGRGGRSAARQPDLLPLVRRRTDGGQRPRAVYSGRLRARLPDAGGRDRKCSTR